MTDRAWVQGLAATVLTAGVTQTAAPASPLAENPIAVAVRQVKCHEAAEMVMRGAQANDAVAIYLGGRMLDDGICIQQNAGAAGKFFERGSLLGDRSSSLEYAAKVGAGEGFDQSYERAGAICRAAGIDAQSRLSDYSLGYVCTLRAFAGRQLRDQLPVGAFIPDSGKLVVEFNPATGELTLREAPHVAKEREPQVGSKIRKAIIEPQREVEKAWRIAGTLTPKPDPARLDSQSAQVFLEVDPILESRQAKDYVDRDHTVRDLWDADVLLGFHPPKGN